MNGAEAVLQGLEMAGVEMLFGIPGTHSLPLYEALLRYPALRHIGVRHEQSAVYMADGYARVTGRVGCCLLTPGPGTANAMAALGEAYASSIPVLLIVAQIPAALVDSGRGGIHEYKDHFGMLRAVTRWNTRVTSLQEIPGAIHTAMQLLAGQRPGPMAIEIPYDLLTEDGQVELPSPTSVVKPAGDPLQVREVAALLARAEVPLILAGGGVLRSGGAAALQEVAERLSAPVVTTFMGRGAIADDHPLALGCLNGLLPYRGEPHRGPFAERFWPRVDLLLAVGAKFSEAATHRWRLRLPGRLLQVDIDPAQLGRNYPASLAICGDAKLVLEQLCQHLEELGKGRSVPALLAKGPGVEELARLKAETTALLREYGGLELELLEAIRAGLDRDAVVVNDMTIMTYWSGRYFPVYEPDTFLYPYGSTLLGYALPAALGAKLAKPQRQVVALCGDGGFLYTCQELTTAVQHRLNVPVILFNDQGYGVLRSFQQAVFGRTTAVDLPSPDFPLLARAFGATGLRVDTPDELAQQLSRALTASSTSCPTLIEVPGSFRVPWLSLV